MLAACLLALSTAALAQPPMAALVTRPGERIENVIETDDGTLYFTGVFNSEVLRRTPDGEVEVFVDSLSFPQGILPYGDGFVIDSQDREPDFTAPGGFSFAGLGARLSVVDADGNVVDTLTGPDDDAFYNGMAFVGPDALLIADPGGERLLRADLSNGAVEVWLDSDVIRASTGDDSFPNGLKVHDGWAYFSRGDIYRIEIGADGRPAGTPILAAVTGGTDDFDVAPDGTIFASSGNDIVMTTVDGDSMVFVDEECPFCTAARVSRDGASLYITGGGLPFLPNPPPGHVSRVSLESVCGRACLEEHLDSYLQAVFENDPAAAMLAPEHRATENAVDFGPGEGPWANTTGYGDVQRRYADPETGQAAYFGYLREGDMDNIVSVRIRVEDRVVTEAEWTIARDGQFGLMDAAGLAANPPPPEEVLPMDERTSRFMMVAIANGYFQALQDHDGEYIPHFDTCERVENGVKVTHRPLSQPLGGPPPEPVEDADDEAPSLADEEISGDCVAGFEIFRDGIAEATMRRFPLVDEVAGVVFGATIFRRPEGNTNRRNLLTEYFYVREGRLAGIWAAMYYLDPQAPWSSGWENR